jgi:putative drug exporter of the RND superfamily
MASLLYRIGRFSYRRWWLVLALWIIAAIGLGGLASSISKPFEDNFNLPDSQAVKAQEVIQREFPSVGDTDASTATIVLQSRNGQPLDTGANHAAVEAVVAKLQEIGQFTAEQRAAVVDPTTGPAAAQTLSSNHAVAILQLTFDAHRDGADSGVTDATIDTVTAAKEIGRSAGLVVESAGSANEVAVEPPSELIGILVAIVVMIITFASLLAAAMPLGAAIIGIVMTTSIISIGTAFLTLGTSTTGLATMIGLAVGIDYSLFVISRFRAELVHTRDRAHAAGIATGTAGSAVVFAGATVVIALVALNLTGMSFLAQMGMGAAVTVVLAVLVALTVLPALLGLFKSAVFKPRIPLLWTPEKAQRRTLGGRVGVALTKRPLLFLIPAGAILLLAAIPLTKIQLGLDVVPQSDKAAVAIEHQAFGAGKSSPLVVVVDGGDQAGTTAAANRFAQSAAGLAHVAPNGVIGPVLNPAKTAAQFLVISDSGPSTPETSQLLQDVRAVSGDVSAATGAYVGVGGVAAIQADFSDALTSKLPIYLVVVVGLAFLLLVIVFRSVIVPLVASLGFLLSIAATFGVTVGVFQLGWFGWIGPEDRGPIMVFMPIFLIGIVFGLAMDYQVFLTSRMREEYHHGATPVEAIRTGYRTGARVVTAAAVIMISVFAGFTLSTETFLKLMGFSMAAAIVFDAFLVRMVIVPAVMALLGHRAWWMPRWLDKVLPKIDVEGEKLRPAAAVAPARPATVPAQAQMPAPLPQAGYRR